jgi:hypothetical protein
MGVQLEEVTPWLAAYGSIVSTIAIVLGIIKWHADRGKLKLHVAIMKAAPDPSNTDYLFYTITNVGRRPIYASALGSSMRDSTTRVWVVLHGGKLPKKLEEGEPLSIQFDNLDSVSHRPDRIFVEDSKGNRYYLSLEDHRHLMKQLDDLGAHSSK